MTISAFGDFVAKYGIFSGIGALAVAALGTFALKQARAKRGSNILKPQPLDFELIPLRFELSLNLPTPEVMVYLQGINYLNREVALTQINVTYFHVSVAPHLDSISAADYTIGAHQSRQIVCRRRLIDSEIRGYASIEWQDQFEASIHVTARGSSGRRPINYTNTGLVMKGYINGLRSHPLAPKPATSSGS